MFRRILSQDHVLLLEGAEDISWILYFDIPGDYGPVMIVEGDQEVVEQPVMVLAEAQTVSDIVVEEPGEGEDMGGVIDRDLFGSNESDITYGTSLIVGFQDRSPEGGGSDLDRSQDLISPYGSLIHPEGVLDVLDQLLLVVI